MLAVVTGASRGIGESYARQLAARGYALHLVARDAALLSRVAGDLRTRYGAAVEEIVLDLARADAAERLYAEVRGRRTAPVDLLVNNAGFGLYGEFADQPMPRIEDMLGLHLVTFTKLFRLFLPEMRERRSGAIINVSSVAGLMPLPYLSLYAATKAFMVSLGDGVGREAEKYGVAVQTCCPGYTDTDLLTGSLAAVSARTGRPAAELRAALTRSNPQGRLVRPEEVAAALLFLCGEGSGAMTGQAIAVAGGEVM